MNHSIQATNSALAPTRDRELLIPTAIKQCDDALNNLSDDVSMLENRMRPCLSPSQPEEIAGPGEVESSGTPMLDDIARILQSIQSLRAHVGTITERLEI